MDQTELRNYILADVALSGLAMQGRDLDIQLAMNAPTIMSSGEYYLSTRGVMDKFGAIRGATIVANMRQVAQVPSGLGPILAEALLWMDQTTVNGQGGINIGHPDVPFLLDEMAVGGLLSSGEAAQLKALPEIQISTSQQTFGQVVTTDEVTEALLPLRPNGRIV